MSDTQESSLDEQPNKIFLRSHNIWKTGDKFPIYFNPSVEEEGVYADAALMYKFATSLVKTPLPSYDYPFPTDPRILEEVRKANGNLDMLQELVKFLNKSTSSSSTSSHKKGTALSRAWNNTELDGELCEKENSDRLSLHLLLSQHDDDEQQPHPPISETLLEKLADEVCSRLSLKNSTPQVEQKKKAKAQKTRKRKGNKLSSSSSSSEASESESKSTSKNDVGLSENEEGKGLFHCPFSIEDVRRTAEPKNKMKGKIEERRFIRKALHSIYSEYQTLKSFVDTIRSESTSSAFKPYSSDLIWLTYHAIYIDLLLLNSLDGPWRCWNELVLDSLTKSFLELLVRASPNRSYPDILDERVRKWMKRKRVGLSAHFGAIPSYLVDAKITDSRIHPKGGWENRSANINKNSSSSSSFKGTAQLTQNAAHDKKA